MRRAAVLLAMWCGLVALPAHGEIAFPALTGRVVDQANVLSAETERALTEASAALERATTNQLVVVTLASLQGQAIEEFGYQLGRQWGIGRAGKNNGVLVLVAPAERAVRIEVGYGLEGTLTDAVAKGIIEQRIIPRLRDGDYDGGVRAGVDSIVQVLSGDTAAAARLAAAGSRTTTTPEGADLVVSVLAFLVLALFTVGWIRSLLGLPPLGGRRGSPWLWLGGPGRPHRGGAGGWSGGFRGGGGGFGGGGASGRW